MKSKFVLKPHSKYLVLFLLTAFLNFNSCRKEPTKQLLPSVTLQQNKLSSRQDYSWLSSKQKVTPQEITPWLKQNLPDGYKLDLHLEKAQQNVINNHHVIRIPIGNDAALFFTKANDSLKVYAYKWLDQKPGEKLFTGKIFTYSFQDQFITAQVYSNGYLIKEGSLIQNSADLKTTVGVSSTTIKSLDVGNGIAAIFCWITGGTWTGFYTNTCAWGQNSWLTKVSNFIASIFDGNDSSGSNNGTSNGSISGVYSGGVSDPNGNYNFYANYSSFGGYSLGNNGAGIAWISLYIPPDSNACSPGSGTPQAPSPTISETSDCNGHWERIQIDIQPESCSQILCRDSSVTNNTRLNRIFDFLDGQNQVFDSLSVQYKNSYSYDLKFFQSYPDATNSNAYTLFLSSTGSNTYGQAFINLNRQYINENINSTYINIIRTVLHETWHAELFQNLLNTYNTTDLNKIRSAYSKDIASLTASQLIDLLDVDQSGYKNILNEVIHSQNGLDKTQQHNYMVKNISVMAKGINQFLIKINSPLANNMEFAYAEALSQLMSVSTYFQDVNNLGDFISYFPGYTNYNITLSQYINSVYSNNINNVGPLP